jgi:hypothetical protein
VRERPCSMLVCFIVAGAALYGCAESARQPDAHVGTSKRAAGITSIEIDKSGLKPLSVPLSIGMKPTKPVDYTVLVQSPANRAYHFVTSGEIQFERMPNGRIVQYARFRSGALENPSNGDRVSFPLSIETAYEFGIDGEIWSIREPVVSLPATTPSPRLTSEQWSAFREEVRRSYSLDSGDAAFECAGQVFGLSGKSISTGFPMGPTNLEEFISRVSICTLAAVRGGDPFHDPAYRADLLVASPDELAQMKADMEESYREQFANTLKYDSDLRIRGTVAERGQEFFLADGITVIEFKGLKMTSTTSALIDPFTGLPYKVRNHVTAVGSPDASEDDELVKQMDGMEMAFQADLPQAVPQVVTISEPKPTITTGSDAGSLSDIYSRSVGAVYLVSAGNNMGTAFALSPTDAITSAHVVEGQDSAVLTGSAGKFQAQIVAIDDARDVALLRSKSGSFPTALPLSSDFPATGAQVAVIGCPYDPALCGTLTTGVVSFSNRPVDGISHIQVDAAINQGNSGGPILNLNGEVIGIAEFKVADPSFVGLSFGLASTEIRRFLEMQQVVVLVLPATAP